MEDAIERAVDVVAAWRQRRQLHVSTRVERPAKGAAAGPARPRPLLRLAATLAPRGAHIAVEARAGQHERTARNGSSAEAVELLPVARP